LSAIFSPAVEITVTPPTYTLVFTPAGIPSGAEWSVTLNGQTKSSTSYEIEFSGLSPGTYNYSIQAPSGYQVASVTLPNGSTGGASGSVTVPTPPYGTTEDVNVTFSQVQQTYSAEFTEGGLPSGAEWSVTLDGQTRSTTSYEVTFGGLLAGTYNYSITPPSGYEVESVTFPDGSTGGASGSVTVPFQGYNPGLYVQFKMIPTATTGTITFVEDGLPSQTCMEGEPCYATGWSVEVDGATYSGTAGSPIKVTVTTGVSHTYRVNTITSSNSMRMPVPYYPRPASGTATAGQTVNVTYIPSQY